MKQSSWKKGFSNGFSLKCHKPYKNVTAKNHQSVHEMPQTTLDLINKEIKLNHISGPREEKPFPVFSNFTTEITTPIRGRQTDP